MKTKNSRISLYEFSYHPPIKTGCHITGLCIPLGGDTTYNRFLSTTVICVITVILGYFIYTAGQKNKE